MFVHPSGVEKLIHEWIDDLDNLHGEEGKEKQFRVWLDRVSSSLISPETWIVKFDKHELSGKKSSNLSYYFNYIFSFRPFILFALPNYQSPLSYHTRFIFLPIL